MKRIAEIIIKTASVMLLLIITVSCISIETEIEFKDEKSGTLKMKYRVSRMVVKTAEIDSDSSFLPLPIEEKDFSEKAAENSNLELVSFNREENSEEIFITAEFRFSDIDALNSAAGSTAEPSITVERKLTRTVFTQILYPGNSGNIDAETMQVVSDLYSSYPVKITVITPSDIRETNAGNYRNNRAEFEMSVPEILSSEEPVVFELSW